MYAATVCSSYSWYQSTPKPVTHSQHPSLPFSHCLPSRASSYVSISDTCMTPPTHYTLTRTTHHAPYIPNLFPIHHHPLLPYPCTRLHFQPNVWLSGTSNRAGRLPGNSTLLGPGTGHACSQATMEVPLLSLSSDGWWKTYWLAALAKPRCRISSSFFCSDIFIPYPPWAH